MSDERKDEKMEMRDAHMTRADALALMDEGEPAEIVPVVWWCVTAQKVPNHWGSRGERAPDGNPYPCCQSRIPFTDVPVEDRGCGLRPLGPRIASEV